MTCLACDGEGVLLVCPDDMCRGLGECIHGDGEIACPKCHGSGEVPNKVDLCDGNCRGCTGCEPEDDASHLEHGDVSRAAVGDVPDDASRGPGRDLSRKYSETRRGFQEGVDR